MNDIIECDIKYKRFEVPYDRNEPAIEELAVGAKAMAVVVMSFLDINNAKIFDQITEFDGETFVNHLYYVEN